VEVLLVDGGSTDDTVEIAQEYAVKIIKLDRRGRTYQRNMGVLNAKGKLLLFIDSDELLPPELVEGCVDNVVSQGFDAMFVPTIDTGSTYVGKSRCLGDIINLASRKEEASSIYIPNSALRFCTQDVFRAIGGQDEDLLLGEDIIFGLKCLEQGFKIGRCKYALLHYGTEGLKNIFLKKYSYGTTFERSADKMEKFDLSFRIKHGFGRPFHIISFRVEYFKIGLFYLRYLFQFKEYARYIPGFFLTKLIEMSGRILGYVSHKFFR